MLLVEHPKPVHQEILMEELWPDAEPDKARMALQTTIRSLRRALDPSHEPRGSSYIEYDDEHYSLLLPEGTSCDAHLFNQSVRFHQADQPRKSPLSKDEQSELHRVLAMFGGEFLPGQQYESFTVEMREQIHRKFLDATLLLGGHLNRIGKHAEAIRILERGVELDPLWGEGVQEMMVAQSGNGEVCRALRLYRDYETRLREDLDLPPDREIQRCFKAIVSAGAGT